MTTNTDLSRVQYLGNSATTAFSFASRILDETHLKVIRTVIATGANTTLILNDPGADGYTVAGVGGTSCTVNTVAAPATGTLLTILRNVPLTQLADYVPNDPFPAETHENALDKLTMIDQQQQDSIDRSMKFPETADTALVPELPLAPVNEAAPVWDGTTGKMKNGPTVSEISNAAANAATAVAAAADAAASAAAAATFNPALYVAKAGSTMTGKLNTAASASGGAGLNVAPGAAPSSPVNGDIWTTAADMFYRINGVTYTAMPKEGGTFTGAIAVPAGATGSQAPRVSEVLTKAGGGVVSAVTTFGPGADAINISGAYCVVNATGAAAYGLRDSTNDIEAIIACASSQVLLGSYTNHSVSIRSNNVDRMVLRSDGLVCVNDTNDPTGSGSQFTASSNGGNTVMTVNSKTAGTGFTGVLQFGRNGTVTASITENAGVVTYGTFTGGHWSQLGDGKPADEIKPGTVLSTIDEFCEWKAVEFTVVREYDETEERKLFAKDKKGKDTDQLIGFETVSTGKIVKEETPMHVVYDGPAEVGAVIEYEFQNAIYKATVVRELNSVLPKYKISDVAGDKRVYGVFNCIDNEGDTITHSLGTSQIRVTGPCAGGDLLESAGDGTARVQSDDVIRSSTIGKVTVGVPNAEADAENLVPCVLYCG